MSTSSRSLASVAGALAIAPGASPLRRRRKRSTRRLRTATPARRSVPARSAPGPSRRTRCPSRSELVCGSGADAFIIHDNGHLDQRGHPLVRRGRQSHPARHPRSVDGRVLEQPAERQDRPVHPERQDHGRARRAGRLRLGTRDDRRATNIYTDPVTHKKVLQSDGTHRVRSRRPLEFRVGTAAVPRRVRRRRHVGASTTSARRWRRAAGRVGR